jgi:hypothetical protein
MAACSSFVPALSQCFASPSQHVPPFWNPYSDMLTLWSPSHSSLKQEFKVFASGGSNMPLIVCAPHFPSTVPCQYHSGRKSPVIAECVATQILQPETLPYALDPSAMCLVSGGFLSPASRLNTGGTLSYGNCVGATCVCAQVRWMATVYSACMDEKAALHRARKDNKRLCVMFVSPWAPYFYFLPWPLPPFPIHCLALRSSYHPFSHAFALCTYIPMSVLLSLTSW